MGALRTLGIGLSMLAAQVGLAETPTSDEAKVETIASMYAGYRNDFAGVPEVDAAELAALQERGDLVLVDVREPKERAVSIIPGAIPKEAFSAEVAEGKTVVAYCTIGYRSGEWAEKQRAAGIDAKNFKGSVLAWSHAGGGFVTPEGEATQKVHVYGKLWDLLRHDYESVY